MFYYLYQIKNKINGKIYVGVHKTLTLNDGYMGSGKVIKAAIEKHGLENFEKTILETFKTSEEMFRREKEIVNEDFLSRSDVYNLRRGGTGGFDFINKNNLQKVGRAKANQTMIEKYGENFLSILGKKGTATQKNNGQLDQSIARLSHHSKNQPVAQKLEALKVANTPESIAKKKETWKKTNRGIGEKNSQFGSMWITDGRNNKKINSSQPIPPGWHKGRITKE